MAVTPFPRDGDDEDGRVRGRAVPAQPEPTIDIIVGGVVFGTIEPLTLKAKALIQLERTTTAIGLLDWCATYGGVGREAGPDGEPSPLAQLEEALGEMDLGAVVELAQSISGALGQAMKLPKARSRR